MSSSSSWLKQIKNVMPQLLEIYPDTHFYFLIKNNTSISGVVTGYFTKKNKGIMIIKLDNGTTAYLNVNNIIAFIVLSSYNNSIKYLPDSVTESRAGTAPSLKHVLKQISADEYVAFRKHDFMAVGNLDANYDGIAVTELENIIFIVNTSEISTIQLYTD